MTAVLRATLIFFICGLETIQTVATPTGDGRNEGMVVEDISEIVRGEERYAQCPPQKIRIGDRCRQVLSDEDLRKVRLYEDYTDCVRKNVDYYGEGSRVPREVRPPAPDLKDIYRYCMMMCMLRVEGL